MVEEGCGLCEGGLRREIWEEEPRRENRLVGEQLQPPPTGQGTRASSVPELAAWHAGEEIGPPLRKLGGPSQLRSQREGRKQDACSSGVDWS